MFNFDEASKKTNEVVDGMLKNYAEVSKGFQAIATEAADYSRKRYEDGVANVEALSSVKSPEALVELQAAYLRSSYDAAIAGISRMGEMYADLGKLAYKPFETAVQTEKAPAKASGAKTAPAAAAANAA